MKRLFFLSLILFVMVSITGCKSNVKLKPGQTYTTFSSKGSITVASSISAKDAKDYLDIRIKDSKKDIKADIVEHFSDMYDEEIKISKFKKGKDYISFSFNMDDPEMLGFYKLTSLEDYADDYYYDVEELSDYESFITYKKEEDLDPDDLIDYEDYYVQYIYGGNDGAYFKTPKNIALVGEDLKYKKISKDTIFVKRNSSGIIIYKK